MAEERLQKRRARSVHLSRPWAPYEELIRAAGFQKFPQLNVKSPTKLFYAARPRSRARQRSVVGRSLPFAVDRRNPGSIRGSICGYKSRRIPN